MSGIGESLKQFWLKQNINLQNGVSKHEIITFERENSIVLPADLKDYFLTINGFESGFDEETIFFLPLSEGFPAAKEWELSIPGADSYFVFADYSISCFVYMIRLNNESSSETPVFIACNSIPQQIADSFTEFAEAYLANDCKVLFP